MHLTVGYIATPSGDDGIALACALAETFDATLDVVIVLQVDDPVMEGSGPYQKILDAKAQEWLGRAQASIPESITSSTHVVHHESFAKGLIEFAEAHHSDMIVVGGSGDGLLDRHSIGSVASVLLHSSPVPLALAPRGYRTSRPPKISKLTVAVPTRSSSANPLPFAITLASAAHIPLRLVSLISLEPAAYDSGGPSLEARQSYIDAAETNLEVATRNLPGVDGLESVVADGSSLDDAVSKLPWGSGDLLAMGSGRLAQPKRVFLGSSAAKIIRAATAPILVVPNEFVQ